MTSHYCGICGQPIDEDKVEAGWTVCAECAAELEAQEDYYSEEQLPEVGSD